MQIVYVLVSHFKYRFVRDLINNVKAEKRNEFTNVDECFAAIGNKINKTISVHYDDDIISMLTQLLRICANLCLDNSKCIKKDKTIIINASLLDTNRQKLLDSKLDNPIVDLVRSLIPHRFVSVPHLNLIRSAFGTLLNLSQDYGMNCLYKIESVIDND